MVSKIQQRAEKIATFRFLEIYWMETLARWTPTTPELEVKVLFGRHLWDLAQHADALGKRTQELRAPLHLSLKPSEAYLEVMGQLASAQGAAERIHSFYEVALPGLETKYQGYLEWTDKLLDEPSARIVQGILDDYRRMRKESKEVLQQLPHIKLTDAGKFAKVGQLESTYTEIVMHGALTPTAGGAS